jgi:hypothetical protein
MTFEKQMAKFWKGFTPGQRKLVESDPAYQAAIVAQNPTRAQELACQFMCGKKAQKQYIEKRVWNDFEKQFMSDKPDST